MAKKVETIKTPASEGQVVSAIVQAWKQVFGGKPTLRQAGMLWAQIAVETSRGRWILNNNVGNINWTPGFNGDWYDTTDTMTVGSDPSKRKQFKPRRRSYNDLVSGVIDYLNLLKNRPPVLKALRHGTPKDFSYALAEVKYYDPYTRDDWVGKNGKKVSGYTSGLTSFYNEFVSQRGGKKVISPPEEQNQSLLAAFFSKLENLLDSLTREASEGSIKMKSINKYGADYPQNKYLISIDSSDDFTSKLEFARILSLALKEELDSNSEIYTDGKDVEVQCVVNAKQIRGLNVLRELCATLSEVFEDATKKIGGIKISAFVMPNESSYYQKLDIKLSETNYRKFQLKFVK